MLKAFRAFLDGNEFYQTLANQCKGLDQSIDQHNHAPDYNLALVVLLLEIALADNHLSSSEKISISTLLENRLQISKEEIEGIIDSATHAYKNASSTFEFTRVINSHFSYKEKCELVAMMWNLAYADNKLEAMEEYTIRKIADLIYVKHSDYIYAKLHHSDIVKKIDQTR